MEIGRTWLSLRQRGLRAVIAVALVGGLSLLALSKPPFLTTNLPCGLQVLTGRPSPFCGGTRPPRAIFVGNWGRAIYLNALAFPTLALIAGIAAVLIVEAVFARDVLSWNSIFCTISRRGSMLAVLALIWWVPHLVLALRTPKPELVDLRNPIAAGLRSKFSPSK